MPPFFLHHNTSLKLIPNRNDSNYNFIIVTIYLKLNEKPIRNRLLIITGLYLIKQKKSLSKLQSDLHFFLFNLNEFRFDYQFDEQLSLILIQFDPA